MSIEVSSTAFRNGERIPVRYTPDGENLSPPLSWRNLPHSTRDIAIIVMDPDVPRPDPVVHWVAFHIDPKATSIAEGASAQVNSPIGVQGMNFNNKDCYDGPAPPRGQGKHHYHFHVYALDTEFTNKNKLDMKGLLQAMRGHILDEGELIGTYERSS